MKPELSVIPGAGPTEDRADALCEAIKGVIYEHGAGMALAAVIGVLEIAKSEILQEQG